MSQEPYAATPVASPAHPAEFDLPSTETEVAGLPLHEYVFPDGARDPRRTLICIPGFSASGRSFARLAPLAAEWDVRMVNGPLERTYPGNAVDTLADVIAAYASRFERPVILGTSFGGLVAIGAVLRLKRKVSGLVLTAAFANGERLGTLPFMKRLLPTLQVAAAPLAQVTARVVGGIGIDPAGRTAIVEDVLAMHKEERARRLRTIFATNFLPRLNEIEAPSLMIHGSRDLLVPRARAIETARALPSCDFHEIRGAGHLPYVTHAEEFVRIVHAFLDRVGGRSEVKGHRS